MNSTTSKNQLIEAYSIENLNVLTSNIIACYKNKQQNNLRRICNIINDFYPFAEPHDKKLFSKLIMLYHPDKISEYQNAINCCSSDESLQYYAHIIPVLEVIQKLPDDAYSDLLPPEDFEAEYGWNYQSTDDDYYILREDDETIQGLFDEENDEFGFGGGQQLPYGSFLEAVKRKIYGPMQINFPVHLLEDMEEIEMAEYEISDLYGVEYCTYCVILDLSYNNIYDLSRLEHCTYIQELYLSDNEINSIDALYHMPDLKIVDLSNNEIRDISPLLRNTGIEFVNIMGNPVSSDQINRLKENGVVVVF